MPYSNSKDEEKYGIDYRPRRAGSFSFDPSKAMDGDFNQMRSEIGDIYCDGDDYCSLLSNEEYSSIIKNSPSWRSAKIEILRRILMLFAYEVNFSIDGLSISLRDRYNNFKKMLDDLIAGEELPATNPNYIGEDGVGGHYFYYGMLENYGKYQ